MPTGDTMSKRLGRRVVQLKEAMEAVRWARPLVGDSKGESDSDDEELREMPPLFSVLLMPAEQDH